MAISARELTLILRVQSAGTSNIRNLSRDLAALEHGGLSFNERFTRASQALGAFGKQAQLAGGIATAALGFAANAAANLQSQVTLAATQVGNNVTQVSKVAQRDFQGILKQMTMFPTASSDMAGALYDIYSTLNVTSKQGLPILTQINKAAVAFGLSARDAGNALLTIMSNFKNIPQTAKGAEQAFTRLGAAVRFGRLTMQQLQTALQSTAPAAKIAGQTLDSMAGTVAFLSRSLGPSKAAVGYARLVEVLSGQQMQDGLKKVNVNIDTGTGKMKQLNVVIEQLVKRFPYLAQGGVKALNFFKTIGNIQGTIQARRAFATLTKDVGGYQNTLSKTTKDNNEFKKSYEVMAKSLGIQWGVLLNTLKSIALQLGLAVIPAFVEMAKPVKEAIAWFQKLDPTVKANIGRLVAFSAVIALVGGTVLTMVTGLGVAAASISALGGAAGIFVAGMAVYGTLAALGVRIYQNWDTLSGLFKNLGKTLFTFFRDFGQAVQAFLKGDWDNVWMHLGDAVKAGTSALLQSLNIMKVSTLKWVEDFAFTLQGAMTAAIAGMFAVNKFAGRGAAAESIGSKLSTADMLSLVLPMGGVSTITRGAAKADDLAKAVATMPFLSGRQKGAAGRAILSSGDMKMIAQSAPFMSAQQRAVANELVARDKIANSWRNQVKQMSQANVIKKQMATLDELERRQLTASSLIRDRQAGIMRTTGGFASAAEAKAGMQLLSSTPAKAAELETAAAAAAVGFQKLGSGIAGAGKSLLSFVGFGNVYVGAAVAATAATYGLYKIIQATTPSLTAQINAEKQNALQLHDSTVNANDAANAYLNYKNQSDVLKRAIADTQKQLAHAKGGTVAYRNALAQLRGEQAQLTTTTDNAAFAQQRFANSLKNVINQIQKIPTTSIQTMLQLPSAQNILAGGQVAGTFASQQQIGNAEQVSGSAKKAQEAINQYTASFKLNADSILQTVAAGQKLTATQKELIDVMGAAAEKERGTAFGANLLNIMKQLSPATLSLIGAMKRIPQNLQGFQAFANSLPQNIIPAVRTFMKLTGQAPNIPFTEKLIQLENASKGAGKEMAAFVGTFARVPKYTETRLIFNRPPWLTKWITDFILKYHKIPTSKQINIKIKGHQQAANQLDRLKKKIDDLTKMRDFRGEHGLDVSGITRQIQKAQQQLQHIKAPHIKGIAEFTLKGNAFKAVPGQAKTAASAAATAFGTLPGKIAPLGTSAGAMFGANFSAKASAGSKVTITVIVNAMRKTMQAQSPSKLFQKQVGDPIIQGIIKGMTDKSSIQSGADTAMNNMVSAFNNNKDTFQSQMGDIFSFAPQNGAPSLQDIASWGGKLTIQELRKNLQEQVHTFTHFQQSLRRLNRKRGVSSSFIEMLRQLGPQNQPEIDALLHAPDKAIRQYVKLWERGQKAVNKAAKTATMSQLKEWRKQGAAVALGFMSGMESHSAQMARYFRNLFLRLFNEVKRVHKSHSPSKLYMQEGLNVAQGFQMGVARGLMRPVGGFGRPMAAHAGGNVYNTTYNIYQARDQSLLGTMRRHDYVTRARR